MRVCLISFTDARGIRHGVEVEAESLYEAVVLAVTRFRDDPWIEPVRGETPLDVEVRQPSTTHLITLQQVERWIASATPSPLEASKKAKLKLMLVQG